MFDIDLKHNSLGVATKKFTSIPDKPALTERDLYIRASTPNAY